MSEPNLSLRHHLLIAMPNLMDPNFYHSVTYICSHDEDGAMGIVINNPLDAGLADLLKHLAIAIGPEFIDQRLMLGGPVENERGFVVHSSGGGRWESSLKVGPGICITTSRDILHALAKDEGPGEAFVALGYAGWGAGQLEQELTDNAWLAVPADAQILFHTPIEQRWHAAAALLGIDIHQMSGEAGRA
ncbi:MAG: YqgE/AlgH family protein [Gammaproteobacteria bacterium]|nr:YqgE/AlgH family protein [Gammaproteobacteria bacterium]